MGLMVMARLRRVDSVLFDLAAVAFRLICRLFWLLSAYINYFLQFPALLLGRKKFAARLLSAYCRQLLKFLGVRVRLHSDFDWVNSSKGMVHIWNHDNPLDLFVVGGHLKIPSITTGGLHLGVVMPLFRLTASNAGHIMLDHKDASSRRRSVYKSFEVMEKYGEMIIAPNGSLVTSIYKRASRSPQMLAKRFSTCIAPWIFTYGGFQIMPEDLYSPLSILFKRVVAPEVTITCSLWSKDLDAIPVDLDKQLFESSIKDFYKSRILRG